MDTTREQTIAELVGSLNDTIEELHNTPFKIDKLPSNFEILVRGVSDSKALDFLFSSKLDGIIEKLFSLIGSGDFESLLSNTDAISKLMDTLFGEGSFRGPVSQSILNNVQSTLSSGKYYKMKSCLGKTMTRIKKINFVLKNLERGKKNFKKDSSEYQKYIDSVYAIKQVLKLVLRILRNRQAFSLRVLDGLHNIVHESTGDSYPDIPLY